MRIDRKARGAETGLRAVKSHYLRETKWGDVIQSWPRTHASKYPAWTDYKRVEFAYAGYWAANSEQMSYATAVHLSKGTELLPRDILVMAMYATLYELKLPDGTIIDRVRDVAQNPQLILDLVTQTVGAILWRSSQGWQALDPGNNGQVLAIINQAPIWQDVYPVVMGFADFIVKTPNVLLPNARAIIDSASIFASWSTPGQISFQRAAFTGDVTAAANSNALAIAAQSITYAKIQNVSATSRILGRITAAAGIVEELTIAEALEFLTGSAPARGDLIYRDNTGWRRLARGAAGDYLQSGTAAADPSWSVPTGTMGGIDIQTFATPGNFTGAAGWQKPTGAKMVEVHVVGAGGSGGSGRRGPTTENSGGGGGGGPGGYTYAKFLAANLSSQVEVNVGTGGAGKAGQSADTTNGVVGNAGSVSTFGNNTASAYFCSGGGGQGGGAGTTANAAGGGAGVGRHTGALGGMGAAGTQGTQAPSPTILAPTGGGGGSGLNATARLTRNGGAGGSYVNTNGFNGIGHVNTAAAGGQGVAKTPAEVGPATGYEILLGQGGGGGWCNNDGSAGAGGAGGQGGGGSGGGGSSNNGTVSGGSAAGGDGMAVVITYL